MVLFLMIFFAAFLRIFRLPEFTEFLGDQGMDALLVLDSVMHTYIPLVGPLSSQNLHQGATYLYLMTPSLLISRFDPLGPAYFMAVLGSLHVIVFYLLAKNLFGRIPALLTASVLTISPVAITQSRTYWNSFLLPLSTTLVLLCFVRLAKQRRLRWFLLAGFVLGFTVQLHYAGLSLLVLALLLWIGLKLWQHKLGTLFAFVSFLAPLIPFFIYQVQHNFVDVRGLILYLLPFQEVYRNIPPPNVATLFGLTFQNLTPSLPLAGSVLVGITIIGTPFVLRKTGFWHKFFTAWVFLVVLLITRNKGDFQIHYMDFLFPIPFLLFACLLYALEEKKISINVLLLVTGVFLLINSLSLDTFRKTDNRLARTKAMVASITEDSKNQPFSFTIISPSFSDSHYRYLLKRQNIRPVAITQNNYPTLFIVCEKLHCPNGKQLSEETRFQVTCFDLHCEGEYPKIRLKQWRLSSEKEVLGGRLFQFYRFQHPSDKDS